MNAERTQESHLDGWTQVRTNFYNELLNDHKQLRDALEEIHAQVNCMDGRAYKWIRERAALALEESNGFQK